MQEGNTDGGHLVRSAAVDAALRATLRAAGTELHDWRLRSRHRRGRSSTSVLVEADVTDATGRDRTLLYVVHRSDRAVPPGAGAVTVAGTQLHVWQFPDDPYLPGLRCAVTHRAAATRLTRHELVDGPPGDVAIHTRSYRPTRRAVVELTPPGAESPALFLKVLGGRDARRVTRRARDLGAVHAHLVDHLPVPRVLDLDADDGIVALAAIPGPTLRQALRTGGTTPTAAAIAATATRIARTPPPPGRADPRRYADVHRHLDVLAPVVPDLRDELVRVAQIVADVGGPVGTVHGDLHDGQLVVDDETVVGLLDVDGAGTGPVAHDLGRLVANVEVAALSAPAHADAAGALAEELLGELTRAVALSDLAAAAAGAWVGLATGPHRVGGPDWQDATRARLARALSWADVAVSGARPGRGGTR